MGCLLFTVYKRIKAVWTAMIVQDHPIRLADVLYVSYRGLAGLPALIYFH